ncbi:MAG: U32 family peptidase [Clostridiales bacterium]|nr:U32 family peptidase [Clostridiales bacterium]
MKKIEILAPAGGFESVTAAVRSGADAVYVGEKQFSARSAAQNFDFEELKAAAAYCHIHGVKLYVTINTLVFDDELEQLKNAVIAAAKADADALIVQNMGVARLARETVPELPLHASTQMSVHTVSGVRALYEEGFKRVVLAREMSREEIIKASEVPVELEVFVHGALCMSVSGQCYFSAMLGSRSGNRGACAQTCRLPFSVGNQRDGYALSLKDNSLIGHIGELEKIGVASAKIEGRMKRPEYVAAAVRAYREQRDLGAVSEKTAGLLRGVFSRTGFTDGYYTSRLGGEMFGTRTKEDVVSASERLLSKIRRSYKDEIRNVAVNGVFTAKTGEKPVLEVTDGANRAVVTADAVCEKAINRPLGREKCREQLSKTGGTAYKFSSLSIKTDDDISLPVSSLNAVRRDALKKLDEMRENIHNYDINDVKIKIPQRKSPYEVGKTRARVTGTKLGTGFKACELVFVPLFADIGEIKRLKAENYNIGVEIPRGMFGRESQIEAQLKKVKEIGIDDVLCHNIGALYAAKRLGFVLHGGFGLNLVNTYDLLWAEDYGIKDVELSFELTFGRINSLGADIPRGIITYGYLPLMLCRNCPVKSTGIKCKTCKNLSKMQDRKSKRFYLKCDGACTEVLNCLPLFIAPEEFSKLRTNFKILRFSVENYVENVENIEEFIPISMLKDKFTRGLYVRGVK